MLLYNLHPDKYIQIQELYQDAIQGNEEHRKEANLLHSNKLPVYHQALHRY